MPTSPKKRAVANLPESPNKKHLQHNPGDFLHVKVMHREAALQTFKFQSTELFPKATYRLLVRDPLHGWIPVTFVTSNPEYEKIAKEIPLNKIGRLSGNSSLSGLFM